MHIAGAATIHVDPFIDRRGVFVRFYCDEELAGLLGLRTIKQVNFSSNLHRGTVRGIHYQLPPRVEMKFIRCLRGEVFSVVVDLRKSSPTYLKWQSAVLDSEKMNMLCVPEGCGHGYQCLRDNCELMYFVTSSYAPSLQAGLRFDDPALGISWPLPITLLSHRDAHHPLLHCPAEGVVA
jgi:dTDP-4-dehydrorhamnose 3,5-epimerase